MPTLRAFLLGFTLAGCSSSSTGTSLSAPADAHLRLVNATETPVAFFVVAADLSPLLDPVPEASVDEPWVVLVQPGAERSIGEIEGRDSAPNGGVAVYLYRLTTGGGHIRFERVILVTGEQILQTRGRIVIR
jgi:hypothetical protein